MFARLLNSLFQRLKRRPNGQREPQAPTQSNGVPDHWLRMQRQVPPEHWVRVTQDASAVIGTSDDESLTSGSATWPAKAKENNTVRSGPDWDRTHQGTVRGRNAEFSESETPSKSSKIASFSTHRIAPQAEMHWLSKSGDKAQGAITRFIRRLSAKLQVAGPHSTFREPASVEAKSLKHIFRVPKTHLGNQSPEWQKTQEKTASAPALFPGREDNHALRAAFAALSSQPRESPVESWFPERGHKPLRHPSRFDGHSDSVTTRDIDFQARRADSQWLPSTWPELPSSRDRASASFSDRNLGQVPDITTFGTTAAANYWPELGADRSSRKQNWRSLMRTVQRSQRRDREQRGY